MRTVLPTLFAHGSGPSIRRCAPTIIVLALVGFVGVGVGTAAATTWPAKYDALMMKNCAPPPASYPVGFCRCTTNYIEARYTLAQFGALSKTVVLRTVDLAGSHCTSSLRVPPSGGTPPYITTGGMEQALEQNGLTVSGIHHATLYAGCTGQGYQGRQMTDPKIGIAEPSYRQFLCLMQVSGSPITAIHTQLTTGGGYTWQAVG